MKLSQLIAVDKDVEITGIAVDSRKVRKGNLFLCVCGEHSDGHDFAKEALKNGAAMIVTEHALGFKHEIVLPDTRRAAASLFATWYQNPQKNLRIYGVTGTNGKSSVVGILHHIYQKAGIKSAICGTLGLGWDGKFYSTENTTPLPEVLYEKLREMVDDGITHLFMEVSSHALALDRVSEIEFSYGVLTNLTPEHLDFHKTMDNYAATKEKLFLQSQKKIFNLDDPFGYLTHQKHLPSAIGYGKNNRCEFMLDEIRHHDSDGTVFTVRHRNETYLFTTSLVGEYNLYNLLAAIAVALSDGIDGETVAHAIAEFSGIKGRLECVYRDKFTVFIDYAHTPDALMRVLTELRKTSPKRLRVVFGCGGDRDSAKRPVMGRIAQTIADDVIVTSDNSRSEDPQKIIADILAGMEKSSFDRVTVIEDRKAALRWAIETAESKDVILVAGKGHEEYEINASGKHPFSETDMICQALKQFGFLK
ncbi:MAG: UDP-N-acetylmuramoyl-L-alanyl-D-glutamate--2,6-diaminopimelate ligase [Clostridia bacterium]|nr:UDP-N-acetylmuramoyl-L-alanyl-D-glutamate--2,6-diaminopimelate ligase [Clostridia bacterium]